MNLVHETMQCENEPSVQQVNLRCVVAFRMRELHWGEQNGELVMIEAAKRLWLRLSDRRTELVSIWVVQHEREDSVSQRSDVTGALLRRNVIKLTMLRSTKSPTVRVQMEHARL